MNPFALDPSLAWLPGTLFGVSVGLWGAFLGMSRGFGWRRLEAAAALAYWFLFSAAVIMLQFGLIALSTGRSYALWFGWLLPGVLGIVQLGCLFPVWLHWARSVTKPPTAAA